MRNHLKKIISVSTITVTSLIATAGVLTVENQPACAQTDSDCIDRLMYTTARANSGPNDRGEWRFYQTFGTIDGRAMSAAGCRAAGFAGGDGWRCPSEVMTFEVMSAAEAVARCNGYVPPTGVTGTNTGSSSPSSQIVLNTDGFVNSYNEQAYFFNVFNGTQTIRVRVGGYNGFDPVLRVEDAFGNILNESDDFGDGLNSQLTFNLSPGSYRAIVSGYSGSSGNYNIVIEGN